MEENGQHKKTRKKEKRLSFWYILGGGVLKEDLNIMNLTLKHN